MMKKMVKDTMKVGVGSMAGLGAVGAMNQIPGMPQNNIAPIVGAGMTIANVGQLSKNAIDMSRAMNIEKQKKMKWR